MLRASLAAARGKLEEALDAYRCVLYYAPDTEEGRAARQALAKFDKVTR